MRINSVYLIIEPALVKALMKGNLRGAALDVFEDEPLSKDNPLWDNNHPS